MGDWNIKIDKKGKGVYEDIMKKIECNFKKAQNNMAPSIVGYRNVYETIFKSILEPQELRVKEEMCKPPIEVTNFTDHKLSISLKRVLGFDSYQLIISEIEKEEVKPRYHIDPIDDPDVWGHYNVKDRELQDCSLGVFAFEKQAERFVKYLNEYESD